MTSKERTTLSRWIGGSVGPQANLDVVMKNVIPASTGNRRIFVQPVIIILTELSRFWLCLSKRNL